jgi:hypothetical protein
VIHCNVMLAHSKKAADPKDDVFDLAGLVENKLFDITDFFVGFVINVDANELGRAPLALLMHHCAAVGLVSWAAATAQFPEEVAKIRLPF